MKQEIIINGIEYVPKSEVEKIPILKGEMYCMVRTYSAGVFCGFIDPDKTNEGRNTIKEAKRIHYWEKSASLSEMAMVGTNAPAMCRVPAPVDIVYLENIIEQIPMRQKAINSINSIPVWKFT